MAISFYTFVAEVPPSPLGLLPAKMLVWHRCAVCRDDVPTDHLVAHARGHDLDDPDGVTEGDEAT